MDKLRTCVLGATGMVGQHFIRILENHPKFEVVAITASERSIGKKYRDATDWIISRTIPENIEEVKVIATNSVEILR